MADVGSISDFEEGRPALVKINGGDIAVVKWRGAFYATAARCPHMGAPLCAGIVGPRLKGGCEVGAIEVDEEVPSLGCPWHGWRFDLRTGQSSWDPKYGLRTYRVECDGERVNVSAVPITAAKPSSDPAPKSNLADQV